MEVQKPISELRAAWIETHAAEIESLKKEHQNIHLVVAQDGKVAVLRSPTLQELEFAEFEGKGSQVAETKTLLNYVFLAGDQAIKTDERYLFMLMPLMRQLVEAVYLEVVKL
jgi:hypothetical protein